MGDYATFGYAGNILAHYILGGGSKDFYFHPYLGKIPNLTNIFQMGWNHQPDYIGVLMNPSL